MRRPTLLALLLPLAACAEFPALDARLDPAERTARPPALIPLAGLVAEARALPPGPGPGRPDRADALAARAGALTAAGPPPDPARLAALQARAEALRTRDPASGTPGADPSGASLP
ncbi:hypothetical protein [Rubellimicrobium arenae]|uniref:hypothetical protein n=1 Tax=Rubellimicrobium arenae TaxID=2817372 RepID=UPI001B3113AB|nr:hypothetical protein [Rubellimicrobium arenae]